MNPFHEDNKRFFLKNGTLHEVGKDWGTTNFGDVTYIKRTLTKRMRGYRWSKGGVAFAQYFLDIQWLTDEEAKQYEKRVRSEV